MLVDRTPPTFNSNPAEAGRQIPGELADRDGSARAGGTADDRPIEAAMPLKP
jgi:hypothetical protein